MPRMNGDSYGLCRTPDGRMIPCNQPLGNGLAQLAMMLHGSGWLGHGYAGSGNAVTDIYQPRPANTSRPAYENSWAAMPGNVGQFDAGRHLPITKAQEVFITPADPYIDTLPWRPYAPEYIPIPPQVRPFPTMPDEIGPVPLIGPNRLDGDENNYPPRPKPNDEECGEQWAHAGQVCSKKEKELKSRARGRYVDFDMTRCLRGLVSEECGGNPVQWGKWKGLQA